MDDTAPQYRAWSPQMTVEPPVELPALVTRIKQNRIRSDTWLYLDHEKRWVRANEVQELKTFFRPVAVAGGTAAAASAAGSEVTIPMLRRMKLFARMEDSQLQTFLGFMELIQCKQFATIVNAGEHGDAMYSVLEGELRVRRMIQGRETTLATLGIGEFFGEISLLDQGPRSADVVANQPSLLLKISAASMAKLMQDSPALAAPFLHALSQSIVGRLRGLNKKYEDSIHFSRTAGTLR
ncbi:MAG: cyclic nucleotide-binding domain-containing protein [Verrucomicrobiota bacterium]